MTFYSNYCLRIHTLLIILIYFFFGNEAQAQLSRDYVDEMSIHQLTTYQRQNQSSIKENTDFLDDFLEVFDEPKFFVQKSSIIQLSTGLRSTINVPDRSVEVNQLDAKVMIPSLSLLYERQVWNNFGAGLSFGMQIWSVPILDYQYRYYTGGLRTSYHFNLYEKLDPYITFAGSYRLLSLTNTERNFSKATVSAHLLIGARYYFSDHLGAHLEIGSDGISWIKAGVSIYLPNN